MCVPDGRVSQELVDYLAKVDALRDTVMGDVPVEVITYAAVAWLSPAAVVAADCPRTVAMSRWRVVLCSTISAAGTNNPDVHLRKRLEELHHQLGLLPVREAAVQVCVLTPSGALPCRPLHAPSSVPTSAVDPSSCCRPRVPSFRV